MNRSVSEQRHFFKWPCFLCFTGRVSVGGAYEALVPVIECLREKASAHYREVFPPRRSRGGRLGYEILATCGST